jgi:hypothetical protein
MSNPQPSDTLLEVGRRLHPRRYHRFKDLRPDLEAVEWARTRYSIGQVPVIVAELLAARVMPQAGVLLLLLGLPRANYLDCARRAA